MQHRLLAPLVAALVLVPAATALAGPTVTVRIEGQNGTLLPAKTVTLPDAKAAGNPCTEANAAVTVAAALEEATQGNWDRQEFVQTILGESHTFAANDYWSPWKNEKYGNGICADTVATGDRVLFLVDVFTDSSTVFPMTLSGPVTVAPGAPFTVTATEYRTDGTPGTGTPTPAADVPVTGGATAATTGADGKATVRLDTRGPATIRAARPGGSRTEPFAVCVTDGADGFCGTTKPGTAGPTTAAPIAPAAADKLAAFGKLGSVKEGQKYARGKGPRTLAGSVDPEQLSDVRLRLSRTDRGKCTRYDGAAERFVKARCGVKNARTFSVGAASAFSYLLPSALPRGRYVLDVIVIDRARNQTTTYQRGRNRVVFTVG